MPHLRNASSSPPSRCPLLPMESSRVDENTDATNGVERRGGEYKRNKFGDAMSSSHINSSNNNTDSSLEDGCSHADDGNNRHDDGNTVPHHTSHLRDTSSVQDSVTVTDQTNKTNNIITPSTEKCSSDKDEKTMDDVSLSNQTQKQGPNQEQRLPLQEKQMSIQDKYIDPDSTHKIFNHGHDDATRAAVAMTSLGAAVVPAISSHTYATQRTNAVTPVAHGMKRKRDLDGGDSEEDESHEASATAYQTPLPTRMTVASPHSEARVHPVTAGGESNLATANTFASKTSHELETANALTKVAHFHQDHSSWSKTPSLLPGSLSSSSWYTPNAGQPSETSHGFFSGAMHSTMYYPEHVVVVGSRGHGGRGGGGGGNISSDGTVGYTTNPFPLGTSTEYFVPNASFYTPHRSISSQYQSFHHPHGHRPISQHGKTDNLEECNGVPLNHSIKNKGEGNLNDIVGDRRNSSTGQEKAINRFSSTYSQYPQTPTAHIRSGTETPISSNMSSQHYHGYYYPPLSAMHPSSVTNGSQLNQASMQYQACYNPRTPSSSTSNPVETKENDSDGEGDKGLCLHNCDRVFVAKNGFVPNKVFPKDEDADAYDVKIPPFQQLVNYPHSSQRKRWGDEMRCVMCGEKHFTSHSRRLAAASQVAGSPESDNMYIIPKQNKGLCTACDNSVWKIRKTGKEIKWCKGCKNFKAWEAFGEKYLATKCVKCREKQKEKYARKTGKLGSDSEGSARKETPRSSSKSKRDKNDLFFVTGQRKGGNADQGLSFLIAASNRVSEQD